MDHDRQTLWQTTHRQYARWLRSLQVKGMHKLSYARKWHRFSSWHARSLVHACVTIVAALTDSRQPQTLLLFMVCVPWHKSAAPSGLSHDDEAFSLVISHVWGELHSKSVCRANMCTMVSQLSPATYLCNWQDPKHYPSVGLQHA